MKLKRLELYGFKSFYDKTAFEFSGGITAIVGPNGCGKSNIVDAIRWVLGEHAPSYLRSKALEDVIFAGSDAAGPLGMAEVTLTFSNEDGGAPPGYESYSEIQVTRRTFRDGDSEFSINRIPCRLKDIAELFLDTGAGARGYAIIEQGRIMSIVNARPEDKRLIIEEAAGVAKFRVRRKEAERKMESARQNLSRIRDVHDEVRRQLSGLERQVRKAERFKRLREELRGLELGIAAWRFRVLSEESARLARERRELEELLAEERAELSRLEAERESRRLSLAAAEEALRELRESHAALKERIARRQAEREGKIREGESLRAMTAETAGEMAAHESEIADLELRLAEGEEASRRREEELAARKAGVAALAAAAEEARKEYLRAHGHYDQARSDLMVRVSLHSNARSSAESLRKMLEENERAAARLEERTAEARSAADAAAADHDAAAAAAAAAAASLEDAGKAWEEAGARAAAMNARLESAVEARRRTDGRLATVSSRLSALSRLYEQRDWASSGVKAVLRHYREKEQAGVPARGDLIGIMGELIETDAAYERAVEAILGERVQSVVVRDQEEGRLALEYLKESRVGRVSFVPVTLRRRDEAPGYGEEDGVIAPLAEVVRAPQGCEALVRGLFGGTLLVRDLSCALRLWNRNGVWSSYVTPEGDVVTADGILMGGAQDTGEAGVLAVKREVRDLERELAALVAEAGRHKADEEEARRERSALEEASQAAFRRREECAREGTAARERQAILAAALSQLRGRVDSLSQELRHLRGERARMEGERTASEAAARESGEAMGTEEERVRTLAAAVEEKRAFMEQARTAFHAAEIEAAGDEEKERSERALLSGMREALASRRAAVGEKRRRLASYEERSAALAAEVEEDRRAVESAAVELTARQEEIERTLAETAGGAERVAEAEAGIREVRRREGAGQERLADLRLAEQRAALDLSALDVQTYQRHEVRPADLPVPGPEEGEETVAREARAEEIRAKMASIGDVNLASIEEHRELSERHEFLAAQEADLEKSLDDLAKAIQRINRTTKDRFADAFEKINAKLAEVFPKLLRGGKAHLTLLDEGNLLETGVEIVAQLPGKRLLPLKLLSGGERTLTAASLIFSIFLVKPSPFCLLDEADAALDDANIDRFNTLVRELAASYQILLITHNKRTMELADVLYGITMEKPGISKVVSVKFQ